MTAVARARFGRSVLAVLARPVLWPTALRQLLRLARPGWWRHRPFLPLPPDEYVEFRLHTQYGDGRAPEPDDLVSYLRWCRSWNDLGVQSPAGRRRRQR